MKGFLKNRLDYIYLLMCILNYALIFPENILLTLFFMSMNTIFTYFRICENSYK